VVKFGKFDRHKTEFRPIYVDFTGKKVGFTEVSAVPAKINVGFSSFEEAIGNDRVWT
jgi:hypothetical protein